MPEDSIMDMVNNIEPMYLDKVALFKKWTDQGADWSEIRAHRNAMFLARRFAASLSPGYRPKHIREAADEMVDEFKTDVRPKTSIGAADAETLLPVRRPLQAFNVYIGKKLIDTVFYGPSDKVTVDEVRRSLIEHDGYDPEIRVVKQRSRK